MGFMPVTMIPSHVFAGSRALRCKQRPLWRTFGASEDATVDSDDVAPGLSPEQTLGFSPEQTPSSSLEHTPADAGMDGVSGFDGVISHPPLDVSSHAVESRSQGVGAPSALDTSAVAWVVASFSNVDAALSDASDAILRVIDVNFHNVVRYGVRVRSVRRDPWILVRDVEFAVVCRTEDRLKGQIAHHVGRTHP